nr:hypothetical protein [Tanacetum cinerariifolium]
MRHDLLDGLISDDRDGMCLEIPPKSLCCEDWLANFPLRLWTSLIVRGDGSYSTAAVLSGHGFIPSRVTTYPRNMPSANPNEHILGLSFILTLRNVRNVSSISLIISSSVWLLTTKSSTYTSMFRPIWLSKALSISRCTPLTRCRRLSSLHPVLPTVSGDNLCLVQICEVDTRPPTPIVFLYHDWVGQPIVVANLSHDPCLHQFLDFYLYGFRPFRGLAPFFLPDRSSSRLTRDQTSDPTSSTNTTPKGRPHRSSKQKVENSNLKEYLLPIATMADQRTMAQLLQAPTEGYEDAIVVPEITADNFELKHGLLILVQNKQFYEHDKEDPHAHIRYFNKITATLKFPNVPNTFTQRFDETFCDAWDRFKDLLRACPHHGFSELHQLDTFYNALTPKDQDSLNSAPGVSTNTPTSGVSPDIAELKDLVRALLLDKKDQNQSPAPVKAVEESCVTCGGAHSYYNCPATDSNNTPTSGVSPDIAELKDLVRALLLDKKVNYNQGSTGYRPQMMSNQIRPPGFPPVANNQNVPRNNQNRFISNQNRGTNFNQGLVYQPPVFQQPACQAHAYQALAPQTQGVSKEDVLDKNKTRTEIAIYSKIHLRGQDY